MVDYTKRPKTAEPSGLGQTSTVDYLKRPAAPAAGTAAPAPAAPAASGVWVKSSGRVSLDKSSRPVLIKKTALVRATASWSSETDYDLYAYVVLRGGQVLPLATFGADGEPAASKRPDGTYRLEAGGGRLDHLGDVGRGTGGNAVEVLEMRLADDIVAVVPVAYSAQSNGTGSFFRYRVTLTVDNGEGDAVSVSSLEASKNDRIYTCVPGVVYNRPEGLVVERLEKYSRVSSEARPSIKLTKTGEVKISMNAGPINDYK